MSLQYPASPPVPQDPARVATDLGAQLVAWLAPFLAPLDAHLDTRLVRTCVLTLQALLLFRHRAQALLLSELGAFLLDPEHAPAGTKRLSNLLRSPKWSADLIATFLWTTARDHVSAWTRAGEPVFAVWDESVLEKPESVAAADFGPVRSSKAARLSRIKPGYFRPPGPPVFVPGLHWLGLLVLGPSGPPTLAAWRWWTSRGPHASDQRTEQAALLRQAARTWRREVIHLFDRGYAGSPWLGRLFGHRLRFVLRWPKRLLLRTRDGQQRPAWQAARGQRSWGQYEYWNARQRNWQRVGVLAVAVRHPDYPGRELWLVVARRGQEPWYLLTNEVVDGAEAAWAVVRAYARRWQIEQTWRYCKSELGSESVRVWDWETRRKLLGLVSLVYGFMLSLLAEELEGFRGWLLRHWGHRTGVRSRETAAPLYRMRAAISRLWLTYRPPPLQLRAQTPG
jgi:hypothetical protein